MPSFRKSVIPVLAICIAAPMLAAQDMPPAASSAPASVDSRGIANTLAARLVSDFVYPDAGKRYAEALKANAAAGRYDGLQGLALARKLTEDVQAVAPDGHLRVGFGGEDGAPPMIIRQPPPPGGQPGGPPKMVRIMPPPMVEHARWIAPGIAFVRFNLFPDDPVVTKAAQDFMATHATAKTIIFDVRTHRGGGLDQMDVIFPKLFAKPARLVTMATRKSVDDADGSPVAGVQSLRKVAGDPDFVTREHWATPHKDKRLTRAKIYVLVSGATGSAAEHFALAFKSTRRGTLIGAPTFGANHFGGDQDLDGGFTAFIPVGRTFDPVTGKDWEGGGVQPDIATAPEDALVKALTLSGVRASEAARLSGEVAPKVPMISRRRGG